MPKGIKIELKRAGAHELSTLPILGITPDWQPVTVDLADFADGLTSFTDMEELLFTFGVEVSGPTGVLYLDNIALLPERGSQ